MKRDTLCILIMVILISVVITPCSASALNSSMSITGSIPDVILTLDKSIGNNTVEYSIILVVDIGNVTSATIVNTGDSGTVLWNTTAIFDVAKPNSTIINVHNHPNGICTPSDGDLTAWVWLKDMATEHGVTVYGNVVLCGKVVRTVIYKIP